MADWPSAYPQTAYLWQHNDPRLTRLYVDKLLAFMDRATQEPTPVPRMSPPRIYEWHNVYGPGGVYLGSTGEFPPSRTELFPYEASPDGPSGGFYHTSQIGDHDRLGIRYYRVINQMLAKGWTYVDGCLRNRSASLEARLWFFTDHNSVHIDWERDGPSILKEVWDLLYALKCYRIALAGPTGRAPAWQDFERSLVRIARLEQVILRLWSEEQNDPSVLHYIEAQPEQALFGRNHLDPNPPPLPEESGDDDTTEGEPEPEEQE